MFNTQEVYLWIKNRLDNDYNEFEFKTTQMIEKYGDDYIRFVGSINKKVIKLFCRAWKNPHGYFLNNTYIDTLFQYLCTREMICTNKNDTINIFEFSPFRGWSTFVILKAIEDSGKKDAVTLKTYEINAARAKITKRNLQHMSDNIAYDRCSVICGDAIQALSEIENESIDLMFIDSDHGGKFTDKYIKAGAFRVCKSNAYIHIHDFIFWLHRPVEEKRREPEVVVEHMINNPSLLQHHVMGQLFTLLGGNNIQEDLLNARKLQVGNGSLFSNRNYFVRNNLPEQYWLGGTILGINKNGIHKNKTWLSGLGMWAIPKL